MRQIGGLPTNRRSAESQGIMASHHDAVGPLSACRDSDDFRKEKCNCRCCNKRRCQKVAKQTVVYGKCCRRKVAVMMYVMLASIAVNGDANRWLVHMHRGKQKHRNEYAQQ